MKEKKGISLITLVITIIVIIILVAAVILTLNNNNPIENAKEATFKSDVKTVQSELTMYISKQTADTLGGFKAEELNLSETTTPKIEEILTSIKSSGLEGKVEVQNGKLVYTGTIEKEEKWFKEIMGESVVTPPEEGIPETESYVGYYADVDGDKQPDGIIYVDLADTEHASGEWDSNGPGSDTYEYTPVTEGLKQYEICNESYTGFGGQWTKPVLTAIDGTTGVDRFYVMALEDFNSGTGYYWYGNARNVMQDWDTATSRDFGSGRKNTIDMIAGWNSERYGARRDEDMWGVIQTAIGDITNPTWFVPSRGEWAAFEDFAYTKMGLNKDNYANYNFSENYWSSSQMGIGGAVELDSLDGMFYRGEVFYQFSVRFSTAF